MQNPPSAGKALRALMALALMVVLWRAITPADPDVESALLTTLERSPDAREWLRKSGREGPLASNRFEGKEDALAFVDALYAAGAEKVVVDAINDDEIELSEGGPYAESLLVRLPADPTKRKAIKAIVDKESASAGEPVSDFGRETIYLWWD